MPDTGQIELCGEALICFKQGLTAATNRNFELAVNCYDRALAIQSNCYEVWYERGLALEAKGDYIEAIANYGQALSLRPSSDAACDIWHDQGNALQYGLGNYSEALNCYAQALKLKQNHEMAWQDRGNALLFGLSLPEEALKCYERALAINPDNVLAWRNRGNTLVELRRFEDAIASYDRALSLQPDSEIIQHARRMAAQQCGLIDHPPTTKPAWTAPHSHPTLAEKNAEAQRLADSRSYHSAFGTSTSHQGEPVFTIEDDLGRREIFLEREQYLVGRDPQSDIRLHSQFVSRHHAVLTKIVKADNTVVYQIVDGSQDGKPSTNGIIINGQKCKTANLKSGDVIVFGPRVQATYNLRSHLNFLP